VKKEVSTEAVTDKRAYSVPELNRLYPVSVGFLRGEIRRGALRVRRFGRRVLVLKEDWDAYVQKTRSNKSGRRSQ
jgi:hypothetical protein